MFEKDAEEYAENTIENWNYRFSDEIEYKIKQTFKDGAEFGYNKAKEELEEKYKETICNSEMNLNSVTERLEELEKANEWHYVKDGDLPTTVGRRFLVSNRYCSMIGYWNGKTFVSADEDDTEIASPIAWCEIPTFDKETDK